MNIGRGTYIVNIGCDIYGEYRTCGTYIVNIGCDIYSNNNNRLYWIYMLSLQLIFHSEYRHALR